MDVRGHSKFFALTITWIEVHGSVRRNVASGERDEGQQNRNAKRL